MISGLDATPIPEANFLARDKPTQNASKCNRTDFFLRWFELFHPVLQAVSLGFAETGISPLMGLIIEPEIPLVVEFFNGRFKSL